MLESGPSISGYNAPVAWNEEQDRVPNVRAATLEDADAIAEVHVISWQESYRGLIPQSVLDTLSIPDRKVAWRNVFAHLGRYPVYVVEEERQILGFGNGGACRSEALGQEMEVYAIYLLARAQRQGIGSKLLRAVMSDFVVDGKKSAGLWVLRDNAIARKFYEKFGALPVGERIEHRPEYDRPEVGYAWPDLKRSFGG
jgi:L-amino acid N-acyltransferase YncA